MYFQKPKVSPLIDHNHKSSTVHGHQKNNPHERPQKSHTDYGAIQPVKDQTHIVCKDKQSVQAVETTLKHSEGSNIVRNDSSKSESVKISKTVSTERFENKKSDGERSQNKKEAWREAQPVLSDGEGSQNKKEAWREARPVLSDGEGSQNKKEAWREVQPALSEGESDDDDCQIIGEEPASFPESSTSSFAQAARPKVFPPTSLPQPKQHSLPAGQHKEQPPKSALQPQLSSSSKVQGQVIKTVQPQSGQPIQTQSGRSVQILNSAGQVVGRTVIPATATGTTRITIPATTTGTASTSTTAAKDLVRDITQKAEFVRQLESQKVSVNIDTC